MARKRKRKTWRAVVLLGVLCICAMAVVKCGVLRDTAILDKVLPPKEGVLIEDAYGVPVHTDLVEAGTQRRPGVKRRIKYIVVHETGNFAASATAQSHSSYLHNPVKEGAERTSWHYTVDDTEIYRHIPDDEEAFHAGGSGNSNGIGIELCVNEGGDFEQTFENAAKLIGKLMEEYDLTVDDVKQHSDFMQKDCPQRIRGSGRWEELLQKAQRYAQNVE